MRPLAPHTPHRIVIVGFPPAQMLDVTGPLEVFTVANGESEAAGLPRPYEVSVIAPHEGPLETTSGVSLMTSSTPYDTTLPVDTLLLAGGRGARRAIRDQTLIGALTALCARAQRVGSICTGTFPLAATGMLNGRRATTHWAHFDELAGTFPQVTIDRDALFVHDGKFHSSAGITAGIDFSLALVEHDLGREIALKVARELVVFMKRPGGQSQFSAQLAAEGQAKDWDRFATLTRWMTDHLAEDLSIETLAERVAMSPRNFARCFAAAMKMTPGKYLQALRVDAARRLLTEGDMPISRIADRCGFQSTEAMRLCFQRHLNISPTDFRDRFRSTGEGAV